MRFGSGPDRLEESGETDQTSGHGDGWLVEGGSAGVGDWASGGRAWGGGGARGGRGGTDLGDWGGQRGGHGGGVLGSGTAVGAILDLTIGDLGDDADVGLDRALEGRSRGG